MNGFLLAASAASFVTFAVHTWIGGPRIVPQLLASEDIAYAAKQITYGCWHLATITLFLMGCAYGWAAFHPDSLDVAWFCFALSASFFLWSAWLTLWKKLGFFKRPQWILFLSVSGLALPGLI